MRKYLNINTNWAILLTLMVLVVASSCKTTSSRTTVKTRPAKERVIKNYAVDFKQNSSLTSVLAEADQKQKLVFVDFYADWCTPCKLMDRDVFMHQPTANFLNEHFVNYKVDVERGNGPDLSVLYSVSALPTMLFLDEKGNVLERKEGAAYQTELIRLANKALNAVTGL